MADPLLEIRHLQTRFTSPEGTFLAADDVSLEIAPGRTLGVVGESGSGKSVTALSILRLLPEPQARVVGGEIRFHGENLLALPESGMRALRGNKISMVFQEPMTALNPVFAVGEQVAEAARLHLGIDRRAARAKAIEMLGRVGLPDPGVAVDAYPHQLSGGMRQRVMIAMALVCGPELLIADEPTTALDVTIQAQILELIRSFQRERAMAVMLITHDLGVVAQTCDQVAVMYAGRVVEQAPVDALFARPAHPYSAALLRSIPRLDDDRGAGRRLRAIPGSVPDLKALPGGCRFRDRCERPVEACANVDPALELKRPAQLGACHNPVPG